MLSRAQFSDQLAELPSSSIGLQSELQIPGTGLSDANIESGGLSATVSPNFDPISLKDTEENKDTITGFELIDTNNKDMVNRLEILGPIKEDEVQLKDSSALDTLREHLNEMQNIQGDTVSPDGNNNDIQIPNKFERPDSSASFTSPPPLEVMNTAAIKLLGDDISTKTEEVSVNVKPDISDKNIDIVEDIIKNPISKNEESSDRSAIPDINEPSVPVFEAVDHSKDLLEMMRAVKSVSNSFQENDQSLLNVAEIKGDSESFLKSLDLVDNSLTTTRPHDDTKDETNQARNLVKETTTQLLEVADHSTISSAAESEDEDSQNTRKNLFKNGIDINDDRNKETSVHATPSLTSVSIISNSNEEKNKPWEDFLQNKDSESTIEKDHFTSDAESTTETIFTSKPVEEVIIEQNDVSEDIRQEKSGILNAQDRIMTDNIDDHHNFDKEQDTIDENSESFEHHPAQVASNSEGSTRELDDGVVRKSDFEAETILLGEDNDQNEKGFETFMDDIATNGDNKTENTEDDYSDLRILSEIDETEDSLLESIRETQNKILGKSDEKQILDNDMENIDNDLIDNRKATSEDATDKIDDLIDSEKGADGDFEKFVDDTFKTDDSKEFEQTENEILESDNEGMNNVENDDQISLQNSNVDDQIENVFETDRFGASDDFESIQDEKHENEAMKTIDDTSLDIEREDSSENTEEVTFIDKDSPVEIDNIEDLMESSNKDTFIDEDLQTGRDDIEEFTENSNENIFIDKDLPVEIDDIEQDSKNNIGDLPSLEPDEKYEEDSEEDTIDNEISDITDEMQRMPSLEEIVSKENTKVSLRLPHREADLVLSSCETRLPSVCYSYEVEVMTKGSRMFIT